MNPSRPKKNPASADGPAFDWSDYAQLMRHDFFTFLHRAFQELNPRTPLLLAPYLELIASHLEDCRMGRTKRLIINLPPRSLKSHCASIAFAAWLLGHRPSAQIICASYGQDLASKLALDCRKLMQTSWYRFLFATRLAPDKQAVDDFMTTKGGVRMATSVGGVLTGRGADFIIVDDPLKPDEAMSQTGRKAVNDWWDGTLLSRLNNKKEGCIIVIMQRLHQDDLVGHILGQDDWTVVNLPAIAENDEEFVIQSYLGQRIHRRMQGQPLHEGRESLEMLQATRERVGDYTFSSQYQQNPIPVGGALVKTHWLVTYDELPPAHEIAQILQSWDTAIKPGELNDYSVCTTWAYSKQKYYLVDVLRKRLDYPSLKRTLIEHALRHRTRTVLIEDKASGSQLLQELRGMHGFTVVPYELPPNRDKLMRLVAQTDLFEGGMVLLPKNVPWLSEYRTELTTFPGAKYDDQVDSTTQALDYMRQKFASNLELWARLGRQEGGVGGVGS